MLKAHLKKVRGMTVQDKEMEKTRQAAKKKLKSDGILCAVMGRGSSGDFETDLVQKKSKKSRGRRVVSSDDESADEAPKKKKKKKSDKNASGLFLGGLKCELGETKYGLKGYVPVVRKDGLVDELKAKAPTDYPGKCNLCGVKGHKSMQCDHKVEVDGETVYPLAYLFAKGLVDKWGVITAKGKEKKGL